MELQLALKYRIKHGEEAQFLEEDEQQEMNKAIAAAVAALPQPATRDEQVLAAREARQAFIDRNLPAGFIETRVSRFLLNTAVNLRYQAAPGQVNIPRKAEGKTKPGVWWGQIHDDLEDLVTVDGESKVLRTTIELDPIVASWLTLTVWQDDKVQNGFPPGLQHWVNVLDEEFERLADEVQPSRKK